MRSPAAAFAREDEVFMRPDHIYFAMTMVKHSTLAVACIYAFKIVSFLVKAM